MTIKEKQCLLYFLGYYVGNIDGDWGTLSKTATKAFQKDFGLTADGVFGDETAKAAKHAVYYGMPAKKADDVSDDWWDDIEYFDRSEFKCHCDGKYCDGYPVEPKEKLIKAANKARKNLGGRATVSSGVRCTKHNANVGGVSNSRHLSGKAMDFCIEGKTSAQTLAYVQKLPEIRYAYAIDNDYVHMDIE